MHRVARSFWHCADRQQYSSICKIVLIYVVNCIAGKTNNEANQPSRVLGTLFCCLQASLCSCCVQHIALTLNERDRLPMNSLKRHTAVRGTLRGRKNPTATVRLSSRYNTSITKARTRPTLGAGMKPAATTRSAPITRPSGAHSGTADMLGVAFDRSAGWKLLPRGCGGAMQKGY